MIFYGKTTLLFTTGLVISLQLANNRCINTHGMVKDIKSKQHGMAVQKDSHSGQLVKEV